MKKLKIVLFLALCAIYTSCEDSYKIVQDGEFGENVTFQTVDDMDSFLSTVYAQMSINTEITFTSIFTDEVGIGNANAGQNLDLYRFFLTNNDGSSSTIWLTHYRTINYANRLLRGAALITPTDEELAEYNSILAQARAIRAFAHFQLMSFFAEDMQNDGSLGVIILDRVPGIEEDLQLPRSTTGEVFAFIESDLAYAEANLIDHPNDAPMYTYHYINHLFIKAFKARMNLYRGNYAVAGSFADEVIADATFSMTPATPYNVGNFYNPATTTNPYRRMWADLAQGEVIFSLSRLPGEGGPAGVWFTNATNLGGSAFHDMGRNLFNLLNDPEGDGTANNADIRRRAFVDPSSIVSPNPAGLLNYKNGDVLLIDKYPGRQGEGGALTNDLKVYRLTEMYLIKAEAYAAAGQLDGPAESVAAILKQIRDVRTYSAVGLRPLPNYAGNATAAWADIMKERRVELCFEGHRYIDIKRLGALAGGLSIDRYYRDCEENAVPVCTLPLTDHRFRLPIPIDEIIGNANIQQNPGY